jgi:hypothetical protein
MSTACQWYLYGNQNLPTTQIENGVPSLAIGGSHSTFEILPNSTLMLPDQEIMPLNGGIYYPTPFWRNWHVTVANTQAVTPDIELFGADYDVLWIERFGAPYEAWDGDSFEPSTNYRQQGASLKTQITSSIATLIVGIPGDQMDDSFPAINRRNRLQDLVIRQVYTEALAEFYWGVAFTAAAIFQPNDGTILEADGVLYFTGVNNYYREWRPWDSISDDLGVPSQQEIHIAMLAEASTPTACQFVTSFAPVPITIDMSADASDIYVVNSQSATDVNFIGASLYIGEDIDTQLSGAWEDEAATEAGLYPQGSQNSVLVALNGYQKMTQFTENFNQSDGAWVTSSYEIFSTVTLDILNDKLTPSVLGGSEDGAYILTSVHDFNNANQKATVTIGTQNFKFMGPAVWAVGTTINVDLGYFALKYAIGTALTLYELIPGAAAEVQRGNFGNAVVSATDDVSIQAVDVGGGQAVFTACLNGTVVGSPILFSTVNTNGQPGFVINSANPGDESFDAALFEDFSVSSVGGGNGIIGSFIR